MLMNAVTSDKFNASKHFQFLQHDAGMTLKVGIDGQLPKTWILLDNQSTIDVSQNDKLLQNIRQSKTSMDIHRNAGVTCTSMVGDLPGYGTVWYHSGGIANILSLSRVKERGYRVTYNSSNGNEFHIHKPDGTMQVFRQSDHRLFYMDTAHDMAGVTLINTVAENRSSYTNREYARAVLARRIQKIIGRPSTQHFMAIVERNLLPNCPIASKDTIAAENILVETWVH
jgi:hypothetical protein